MREITEKTFSKWHDKRDFIAYPYGWYSCAFPDVPACVPTVITAVAENSYVGHFMKVTCKCPDNSKATVVCVATVNGKYYKGFHKPGECPYLKYKVKR